MGKKIKYVEDVIGSAAQNEIKNLKNGEILLLEMSCKLRQKSIEYTGVK